MGWSSRTAGAVFALVAGVAAIAQPPAGQPMAPGQPPLAKGAFAPPPHVVKMGVPFARRFNAFAEDVQFVDPFRIVGNVYYVGTSNTASYLITGAEGHILVDAGPSLMMGTLVPNIVKLGFDPKDVKIILSSHAHFDHAQGLAVLQRQTGGAPIAALAADVPALESGKDLSSLGTEGWEPVKVARVLKDGEAVKVGAITVRAMANPGHTQGNANWLTTTQDGGRSYTVLIGNVPQPAVGNPKFATSAADVASSFAAARAISPDLVLAMHPARLFEGKLDAMRAGVRPHPLQLAPGAWARMVDEAEADYRRRLANPPVRPGG